MEQIAKIGSPTTYKNRSTHEYDELDMRGNLLVLALRRNNYIGGAEKQSGGFGMRMGEAGRWGEEPRCKEAVQVSAVVFKTEQSGVRTQRDWSTKDKV